MGVGLREWAIRMLVDNGSLDCGIDRNLYTRRVYKNPCDRGADENWDRYKLGPGAQGSVSRVQEEKVPGQPKEEPWNSDPDGGQDGLGSDGLWRSSPKRAVG